MKDLDFDELDKAVSSLMAGVPKADEPAVAETPAAATNAPSVPADDSTDTASAPATTTQSSALVAETPKPATPSTPPLAARRGGRFMDVVRPGVSSPAMPRPLSRQGATLNPTASIGTQPVDTSPIVSPPPRPPLESTPPATAPTNEWPDPLEMASLQDAKAANEPTAQASDSSDAMTGSREEAPLTTPFLSGAKVEKRPLGALATELSGAVPETDTSAEPEHEDLPAKPKDVASILPEELHSAVMAIESDATTATPPQAPVPPTDVAPEKPVASMPSSSDAAPAAEKEPSTGPTSIAQQYREEPSTGDQKNGAIFDTDTYHQPLSHPVQKKNGWMWVVWIILILLVGAAGGAALYIFRIV